MTLIEFFDATNWADVKENRDSRRRARWWLRSSDTAIRIWLIKVSSRRYYLQFHDFDTPSNLGYTKALPLRKLVPILVTFLLTQDFSALETRKPK